MATSVGLAHPGLGSLSVVVLVTQLTVYGMCCQYEVELVNSKLRPLPGVSHVAVNLLLRRVAVDGSVAESRRHRARQLERLELRRVGRRAAAHARRARAADG